MSIMISNLPPRINNNIAFKGYDARPIQGFVLESDYLGIASELKMIGEKEGFYVDCLGGFGKNKQFNGGWLQDYVTIVNDTVCSAYENMKNLFIERFRLTTNSAQERLIAKYPYKEWQRELARLANYVELKNGFFKLPSDDKLLTPAKFANELEKLSNKYAKIQVAGGNFFIAKGKDGAEELLIGRNSLENVSEDTLKEMFGVEKIIELPQSDFHMDMVIRPLDNQRVLVADDKMTLQVINDGIAKVERTLKRTPSSDGEQKKKLKAILLNLYDAKEIFDFYRRNNQWASTRSVERELKAAGYTPVRVPGRLYLQDSDKKYNGMPCNSPIFNFMNANVIKKPNGDLVYITNSSPLDKMCRLTKDMQEKLDFGFERAFIKALEPYVKKEHIHFIHGQKDGLSKKLLRECNGGIHCLSVEVPPKLNKE